MNKFTKNLNELNETSLLEAGGKGTNLGALIRAGLPVPSGFVVTTDAYRTHLRTSGLYQRIAERLTQLDSTDSSMISKTSSDITSWIKEEPMPDKVRREILENINSLSEKVTVGEKLYVAIRSSAIAEDLPTASFAGQHDTFLGVSGDEAILEHIRLCWLSLWSPQAIIYRTNMGFNHLELDLAVVVQTMVDAQTAGVMFTANPVNGNENELVISAGYGLGEAVVSGIITPDTYILTKDGNVKEKIIGKKHKRVYMVNDGTQIEDVPHSMQEQFCLNEQELKQLTQLANLVESYLKNPQDIEWASYKGQIYLLQTRPITTLNQEDACSEVLNPGDRIINQCNESSFMLSMIMERFSEPMKPLDFACMEQRFRGFNTPAFKIHPLERENGCVAIDLNNILTIDPECVLENKSKIKESAEDVMGFWKTLSSEINLWLESMQNKVKNESNANKLAELLNDSINQFGAFFEKRSYIMKGPFEGNEQKLEELIINIAGEEKWNEIKSQLFKAIPFKTALQNDALVKLAKVGINGMASKKFQNEFDRFLLEYGDRPIYGITCMLSTPTWRENPEIVYGMLDTLLKGNIWASMEQNMEKLEAEYNEAVKAMENNITLSEQLNFRNILEAARNDIIIREDSSFMLERLTAGIRKIVLKLGTILTNAQLIHEQEDVFYLFLDELNLLEDKTNQNLVEKIEKRKCAFTKVCNAHKKGIHWMIATGSVHKQKNTDKNYAGNPSDGAILRGIPVSSGVYTGTVCIVNKPSDFNKLKHGDIMVSPYTSPVWTPLFKVASALVTEIGSPISHAAIIAREYEIPAVVAIENVTNKLWDGQKICVDGLNGIVTVLKEECADEVAVRKSL